MPIEFYVQENVKYNIRAYSRIIKNRENIQIPEIQRDEIVEHVNEISEYIDAYFKKARKNNYDIIIPYMSGPIQFARVDGTKIYYLIDGQHRWEAYRRFYEKYNIDFDVHYTLYDAKTMKDVEDRFNLVNKNKPLPFWKQSEDRHEMLQEVKNHIKHRYNLHISRSERPQFPNINVDKLMDLLEQHNEFKECENSKDYIALMERKNSEITNTERIKNPDKVYKASHKCGRQGLMLGILMNKVKKKIPNKIRKNVWKRFFVNSMKGECLVCHDCIEFTENWICSHYISEANGGKIAMDNLFPTCKECSSEMHVTNADIFYMKRYEKDFCLQFPITNQMILLAVDKEVYV